MFPCYVLSFLDKKTIVAFLVVLCWFWVVQQLQLLTALYCPTTNAVNSRSNSVTQELPHTKQKFGVMEMVDFIIQFLQLIMYVL
jgi:hypothetical protein